MSRAPVPAENEHHHGRGIKKTSVISGNDKRGFGRQIFLIPYLFYFFIHQWPEYLADSAIGHNDY
jgi:hypothetical protein